MFDANGGTVVPNQTLTTGSRITAPTATMDGYTLDGWYYNGEKWDFATDTVSTDMVLTAVWTETV